MKNIIFIILALSGIHFGFSQTKSDSLLIKRYEDKILENAKLNNDLQLEKKKYLDISNAYKKDSLAYVKQIADLENLLKKEQKKVAGLNKSNLKKQRNSLRKKVDSLTKLIAKLKQTISNKEKQIAKSKEQVDKKAKIGKEKGKQEVLSKIKYFYKNKSFDELLKGSSNEIIERDRQLLGNSLELKPVFDDLTVCFKAKELFTRKYDGTKTQEINNLLNRIHRQSKLFDEIKDAVEYYEEYSSELKKAIQKIVSIDNKKSTGGNPKIQEKKYKELSFELSHFIYDYYDYIKYPYLSDIVTKIIYLKFRDADSDVTDLLKKL